MVSVASSHSEEVVDYNWLDSQDVYTGWKIQVKNTTYNSSISKELWQVASFDKSVNDPKGDYKRLYNSLVFSS